MHPGYFTATFLGFIICFTSLCNASETEFELKPESSISVGGGYDSDKNKDYTFAIDLELSDFQRLGFAYARNVSAADDSKTHNYSFSTSSSAYEKFSLDATFDYNDVVDALETYSISSSINLNLENWHFAFGPKLSAITFFLDANHQNKFDIYAKGAEVSTSYFGFEQFYFSASLFNNIFSEKPFFLRQALFSTLNTGAISRIRDRERKNLMASSLEEQRFVLTAGRTFDWGNLDFTWSYVKLFNIARWLDFAILEPYKEYTYVSSYYGSSNYIVSKHLSIGLLIGIQSLSNSTDTSIFTSSQLSYTW